MTDVQIVTPNSSLKIQIPYGKIQIFSYTSLLKRMNMWIPQKPVLKEWTQNILL